VPCSRARTDAGGAIGREALDAGMMASGASIKAGEPGEALYRERSEDKVLIPHHHVSGEKDVDIEADFTMTLKVDAHGKPIKIGDFSFDDDNFIWVELSPSDYEINLRLAQPEHAITRRA
jgi:hypothetical protein